MRNFDKVTVTRKLCVIYA